MQCLQELVALLYAAYIVFDIHDIYPRSSSCDKSKMRYIFSQIFPFQRGLRKDKIATWLHLSPSVAVVVVFPFRNYPEPGSLFPRSLWGEEMRDTI